MAYPIRLTQRIQRPAISILTRHSSAFRHSARLKLAALIIVSCLLFLYSSRNRYSLGRRRTTVEHVSRYRPLFAPNQPLLPSPLADLQPVSAYLDSRPAVMDLPPKILLLAVADTLRGDPGLFTRKFDDNFSCAVRVQKGAKLNGRDWEDVEVRMIRATVELLDDHHLAPLGAAWVDCEGAEDGWFAPDIQLSVSLVANGALESVILETPEAFIPVSKFPTIDIEAHAKGHGTFAACLAPLQGDLYAPFLPFWINYYQRVLGFDLIFVYISDPGPAVLESLKKSMHSSEAVIPIRLVSHKNWVKPDDTTSYHVPPNDWKIPELLHPGPAHQDFSANTDATKTLIHYGGQVLAANDCNLRAMAAGARWVLNVDIDEFIVPSPAGGAKWTAAAARDTTSKLENPEDHPLLRLVKRSQSKRFAPRWNYYVGPLNDGSLGAAYQFRHSFLHADIQPPSPPPEAIVPKELLGVNLVEPDLTVAPFFTWAVRDQEWLDHDLRAKTLVNPWAFRTYGIHMPFHYYVPFMLTHYWSVEKSGHQAAVRSNEHVTQAQNLWGGGPFLIEPYDSYSSPHHRAGLLHARALPLHSALLRSFGDHCGKGYHSIKDRGTDILRTLRNQPFNETIHMTDWTALDVLGAAVVDTLCWR